MDTGGESCPCLTSDGEDGGSQVVFEGMEAWGIRAGEPKQHVLCDPRTHVISELEGTWRSAGPPSPGI